MISIEKKIRSINSNNLSDIDQDAFLDRLHSRLSESEKNRRTFLVSFCMLLAVSLMTITKIGAPSSKIDNYYVDSTGNLLETDFWNIKVDSLDYNQDYYNDMAYFLLDEGYVWEVVELLEKLEAIKEKS